MLRVRHLSVEVLKNKQWYDVIQPIDFTVHPGEILGLIGESGSGKSITAKAIAGMLPKKVRIRTGDILFNGESIRSLGSAKLGNSYGKQIAFIMQNAAESLNPIMKIGLQLTEAYLKHHHVSKNQAKLRALEVLEQVGIKDVSRVYASYPHQLSISIKQQAVIAMAIINKPAMLIADEPTTAQDPIAKKQLLNLLKHLRDKCGMGVVFISHDLHAVRYISDSIFVLYGGAPLEYGEASVVLDTPLHPYTDALLKASPSVHKKKKLTAIGGSVPSIYEEKKGCIFSQRCHYKGQICMKQSPSLSTINEQICACHFPLEIVSVTKEELLE